MQLMTQAQFARHRGAGKSSATNWKNAGLLVMAEGPHGKPMVDVERSDARLNAKLDPMRGRPSTGHLTPATESPGGETLALPLSPAAPPTHSAANGGTLADERLEELRERRIGAALKNAQAARELVPLIEAERRVSEVGRATRERMHAWLRQVAERFAAEKDVRTIMALGEEGIDQVFAELADAAVRGEFSAGEDEELSAGERAELETLSADE